MLTPFLFRFAYYTMMPQAEWYNVPYFSVPPLGGRKVARIKYNNRFAIIIPQISQNVDISENSPDFSPLPHTENSELFR
jgi:hypothetical protein